MPLLSRPTCLYLFSLEQRLGHVLQQVFIEQRVGLEITAFPFHDSTPQSREALLQMGLGKRELKNTLSGLCAFLIWEPLRKTLAWLLAHYMVQEDLPSPQSPQSRPSAAA